MKILIVGSGGREHAIAWKLSQNKKIEKIFIAPGNAVIKLIPNAEIIELSNDIDEYVNFSKENNIDLTIVGSEELLVQGIVDKFKENELKIFGPNKKSAILEGSKVYSKDFMKKYGIKTAIYEIFDDFNNAKEFLSNYKNFPVVIKASGLAAGKGVIIAKDLDESIKAIDDIMITKKFGSAGDKVVIEEFLDGVEASILSFTDSKIIVPLISAKDHKKIGENETGLNTGGMGVISPNPYVTDSIFEEFKNEIMNPTLNGIQNEGMDFEGVIFFGIMITKKGVYLLEYNMRMGDPETQAVLPLLENDLLELISKAFDKKLSEVEIKWKPLHSCCVVGASAGYPENYENGNLILGIEEYTENEENILFLAGSKSDENGNFLTNGGRVLNAVGLGKTLEEARKNAYSLIGKIKFDGIYFRKDIGIY
ncbi:MAG: phosphoribosylamine--glycine ligase [Leptotrichiaceae bacterium]|nr:phosphoribosylamine--glycine ligase [Leptotrichiaceae bacterium]MBP6282142.1 phosphoribosylamine--glycine ligase [Leptotrichiaceae bacterium]MBP7739308.1 phosphoribosylamine--glycine ligase [Leptotrichiaceae bacterium]MBP9629296.1 phosphoribosylamine--glycine ligase [Leptotrichiaceae bacterium]